jgi:hypothetical protein
MPVTIAGGLWFCGRELKPEELDLIRQITRDFSTLSLTELAHTVCELLEWRRPNGGLKSPECYDFLQTLHGRGWLPWLSLQPKKLRPRATVWYERSDAQASLTGAIGDYLPLHLQLLDNSDDRRLFRQYIQRYHYLGYKVPYGAQASLFRSLPPAALSADGLPAVHQRRLEDGASRCLHRLEPGRPSSQSSLGIQQQRFLILPWVRVPNLASHILSLAARRKCPAIGGTPIGLGRCF